MSPSKKASENEFDSENVGGLGEIIPQPLMPIWTRIESIQKFREVHGETYTTALEVIVAAILIGGYLYWMYLFFLIG